MTYTYKYLKDFVTNTTATDVILRKEDNACIPIDEGNRDYIEYKAWLDAGNTPEAAD
tara:strand:- start:65 stop:235 length:171 start_codon:yes stop_codon:yes gene_type:complete